ncbi:hypothetical protein EIP91_010885 [Steccherinum ochraceum]|uniref:Uncharacterized protein n=1 Tax=Steccherinum ochraceum TaxID=92696 RepID=A0A4R0RLD8_9APHY|nr:hypothetical protein EIP91_010885 [Steccherinum ochraceum]
MLTYSDNDDSVMDESNDVAISAWTSDTASPLATPVPELLVHILLFIINGGAHYKKWKHVVRYASVCRYWREVVLRAPMLWRNLGIENGTSHQRLRMFLERTQRTSLNLEIHFRDDLEAPVDLDLVYPEMKRVQHLRAVVYSGFEYDLPDTKFDMPMLQTLEIESVARVAPILVSSQHSLPSLKSLVMRDVPLTEIVPFFRPSITNFQMLLEPPSGDMRATTIDILHSLQSLPRLERLQLSYCFTDGAVVPDEMLPSVTLPDLKALDLDDDAQFVAEILGHLVIPFAALLGSSELKDNDTTGLRCTGDIHGLRRVLAALSSKLLGERIIGQVATDGMGKVSITVQEMGASEIHVDGVRLLSHALWPGHGLGKTAGPFLSLIITSLSAKLFPRLAELRVVTSSPDNQIPADVLTGLSYLEALTVSSKSGWDRLVVNAHDVTRARSGDGWHEDARPNSLPFPRLRRICLVSPRLRSRSSRSSPRTMNMENDFDLIWLLKRMLQMRMEAEFPLSELTLVRPHDLLDSDMAVLGQFTQVKLAYSI